MAWLKTKNPASEAVRREREEEWRCASDLLVLPAAFTVHQTESRMKASTATLRTIEAIPATTLHWRG
jgi:hypothetical protein